MMSKGIVVISVVYIPCAFLKAKKGHGRALLE